MLLKPQALLLTAIIAAAGALPASAQGFDPAEVKRINEARKTMPNIGRGYGLRITTGSSNNAGFEKAIVDSDPNMKHWCWIPVTSLRQAYIHTPAGQPGKNQSYQRPQSVYKNAYQHVPLPVVHRELPPPITSRDQLASHSKSEVSGKLSYARNPAPRAAQAETRVYGYSDGYVSGRLMPPRYNDGLSASRSVSGKLLSRTD